MFFILEPRSEYFKRGCRMQSVKLENNFLIETVFRKSCCDLSSEYYLAFSLGASVLDLPERCNGVVYPPILN